MVLELRPVRRLPGSALLPNYNSQQALLPGRLSRPCAHALADVAPGTRRRGAVGKWQWRLDPAELRAREPEWRPEPAVGSGCRDGVGQAGVATSGDMGEAVAQGSGRWAARAPRVRVCAPSPNVSGDVLGRRGGVLRARRTGTRWSRGGATGLSPCPPAERSGAQGPKGTRGCWPVPPRVLAPPTQLCGGTSQGATAAKGEISAGWKVR